MGRRKLIRLSKSSFERLYRRYAVEGFIEHDPIKFMYEYKDARDREVIGLIASLYAFGRRDKAIEFINKINAGLCYSPHDFIYKGKELEVSDKDLYYRLWKAEDVKVLLYRMHKILRRYGSLKTLFLSGYSKGTGGGIDGGIEAFSRYYNGIAAGVGNKGRMLLPIPSKGSVCKRFNMYLRWLVRKDKVDTGLWQDEISPSELYIPVDVHVARISQELGITGQKAVSRRMLMEIMEIMRSFDSSDPARYDFSMFGYGIERGQGSGKIISEKRS